MEKRIKWVFKNRFGHFRAGWRIVFYSLLVIALSKILDLLGNSVLLNRGENPGDYALLLNRLISKFLKMLAVWIPGLVLLKWVDKRPVALLGTGCYKGCLKELFSGMLMGFGLVSVSMSVLWMTGLAFFSWNGLSTDMFLYLLVCLVVLVVSASYEEILFRGYIFQSLIEGTSFWITLGIFSLLFGAGHLGNANVTVFTIACTVIAGAFLGTIYFKTRALWMCIGTHFMWNWTMGSLFGMGISESKFARRSLFTYKPLDTGFFLKTDAMSEIILGILVAALTIFIWKAKWLKPADYSKTLWAKYPPGFGKEPEKSL